MDKNHIVAQLLSTITKQKLATNKELLKIFGIKSSSTLHYWKIGRCKKDKVDDVIKICRNIINQANESVPTIVVPLNYEEVPLELRTIESFKHLYEERIAPLTETELARVNEWIDKIKGYRPNDYLKWLWDGVAITISKGDRVRGDAGRYVVGLYKQWTTNGFGSNPSSEHNKVFEIFEQRYGIQLSQKAGQMIQQLIYEYGIVYTMNAIFNVYPEDMSSLVVKEIGNFCEISGYPKASGGK